MLESAKQFGLEQKKDQKISYAPTLRSIGIHKVSNCLVLFSQVTPGALLMSTLRNKCPKPEKYFIRGHQESSHL